MMIRIVIGSLLALSAVNTFAGEVTFVHESGDAYTVYVPDKIEKYYGKDKKAMYEAMLRISGERLLLAHLGGFQLDRRIGTHIPERDEILLKNGIDTGAKMGMTKNQVLAKTHWGKPDYINTITDEIGKMEQWIYWSKLGGSVKYLMFDRSKLISIGATFLVED